VTKEFEAIWQDFSMAMAASVDTVDDVREIRLSSRSLWALDLQAIGAAASRPPSLVLGGQRLAVCDAHLEPATRIARKVAKKATG
jgi:hypothetical protein